MSDFDDLVDNVLDDVLEQDDREKKALQLLLDKQTSKKGHLFALRSNMGATKRSYVTSASLEWVAQKVRFARDLPIFSEKRDEHGNIVLDKETAEIVQQRDPDWRRQFPMTMYLAQRKYHKFPPILVVVTQDWVDDPNSDEWSSDETALKDSITASTLDSHGVYADVHITERDCIYAIDGQHRLMAIRGLSDLINEGRLFQLGQKGDQKSRAVTLDDLREASNGTVTSSSMQLLLSEKIGVEIVPAVLKGETHKEALLRLRTMFVHLNRTAVALSKGQLALLDEDNGFAVVARQVMGQHALFNGKVKIEKGQLTEAAKEFTTLETLERIATEYLVQFDNYDQWKPNPKFKETMPVRPDEESLVAGSHDVLEFVESLSSIPSYSEVMQGASPKTYRQLEEGGANLLFRPVGQIALAIAVGKLVSDDGLSLNNIMKKIGDKEAQGGMKINIPQNPWYGVVYDHIGEKMRRASPEKLAARILVHLLGGGTQDDEVREKLRSDFANSRLVDREQDLGVDLEANRVPLANITLPAPW